MVTELCLELAAAREELHLVEEDELEVLATRARDFYIRVLPDGPGPDDPRRGLAYWRAICRRRLCGEDL
jgi:hypothetical protein